MYIKIILWLQNVRLQINCNCRCLHHPKFIYIKSCCQNEAQPPNIYMNPEADTMIDPFMFCASTSSLQAYSYNALFLDQLTNSLKYSYLLCTILNVIKFFLHHNYDGTYHKFQDYIQIQLQHVVDFNFILSNFC